MATLTFVVAALLVSPSLLSALPYTALANLTPQMMSAYLAQARHDAMARVQAPSEDLQFNTDKLGLGTVSGVDVDSNGDLYILHRSNRPWTDSDFVGDVLAETARSPIEADTIVKVTPDRAQYISSFGAGIFSIPHGITIDNSDNVWVTDVGRHQVFRFPKNSNTSDLVLGEQFVPGNDEAHFCKPTDVAVASTGEFFVSDGYCNSRVMKFSKDGQFITQWGTQTTRGPLTPFSLNLVHSVILIEKFDLVCVADRQNQRAMCYNAGLSNQMPAGSFNRTLIPEGDIGRVFALAFNEADNAVIAASDTSRVPYIQYGMEIYPARAYTYTLGGMQAQEWAYMTPRSARRGPSLIHDLCTSKDGKFYYLADLPQQRVLRFYN